MFNCNYNGLSIIQELGLNGINCIAMDSKRSIGTYSKYARFAKCPDPFSKESDFVDFLYDYSAKLIDRPVLFPTNDKWAAAISKYKKQLLEVSIPCVANWETVSLLLEKNRFYEVGQQDGFLTPKTWSKYFINQIENEHFPIVAKPIARSISSDIDCSDIYENMHRLRLTIIGSKTELNEFLFREDKYIDYLVFQEYIRGNSDSMFTVGIYADQNHEVKGIFYGKKIRGYPADFGDCVVGENHSVPAYVLENTFRITKLLRYSGIAEFEYKRDSITGDYRLIEINPRSWSWIGITPYCNANLALIAYEDLLGIKIQVRNQKNVKNGAIRYAKILQDIENCFFNYKVTYPTWHMSLHRWLQDYRKPDKIVYAEFHAGDYPVAIIAVLKLLLRYSRYFMKRFIIGRK